MTFNSRKSYTIDFCQKQIKYTLIDRGWMTGRLQFSFVAQLSSETRVKNAFRSTDNQNRCRKKSALFQNKRINSEDNTINTL